MPPPIPLTDEQRAELRDTLGEFDVRDRKHGLRYLQDGRVRRIEIDPESDQVLSAFFAVVEGADLYDVDWHFAPDAGWEHTCTCESGSHCKHAYAAAVLALGDAPPSDRSATARARLARRVKHFMLRRTKGQVATDLPRRSEEDLFIELDGVQRQLYDAELKRTRALLLGVTSDRDFDQQRFNLLQSLLRLRQICCDPRLVGYEEGKKARPAKAKLSAVAAKALPAGPVAPPPERDDPASPADGDTGSAKLEALLDTLEPLVEEGHRVLVFSQFVTMLELIAAELKARGIGYLKLTGQTENRQELVNRFQSETGEPVFLLSLKAAGSGLNLTAASYVVLFDPWWNPAVEAQAIDRTHRIGQTEQVIAYRLLARDTIEEKIRQLQQAKAELAHSIVQEETLATVMSLADLRFVLGTDGAE